MSFRGDFRRHAATAIVCLAAVAILLLLLRTTSQLRALSTDLATHASDLRRTVVSMDRRALESRDAALPTQEVP